MYRILTLTMFVLAHSIPLSAFAGAPTKIDPEVRVLTAIDNICGDTWCEGDFQFRFNKVSFDRKQLQTVVDFTMTPYAAEEAIASDPVASDSKFEVQCIVGGFADASTILKGNGSLDEAFYTSLSECVNNFESFLVKRLP